MMLREQDHYKRGEPKRRAFEQLRVDTG
jgi:hypothetical protein